jgi:hypothetical protein
MRGNREGSEESEIGKKNDRTVDLFGSSSSQKIAAFRDLRYCLIKTPAPTFMR